MGKEFCKKKEADEVAAAKEKQAAEFSQTKRIEPKAGVPSEFIFSHGPISNQSFQASISRLHYTNPASREYGAESDARVHKSFFYGSKHIDKYVPQTDPNAPIAKMSAKQAQWAAEG